MNPLYDRPLTTLSRWLLRDLYLNGAYGETWREYDGDERSSVYALERRGLATVNRYCQEVRLTDAGRAMALKLGGSS